MPEYSKGELMLRSANTSMDTYEATRGGLVAGNSPINHLNNAQNFLRAAEEHGEETDYLILLIRSQETTHVYSSFYKDYPDILTFSTNPPDISYIPGKRMVIKIE